MWGAKADLGGENTYLSPGSAGYTCMRRSAGSKARLREACTLFVHQRRELASGERVSRGDVALLRGTGGLECGQVWALLDLAKGSHALMHSLAPLARESTQGECQVLETRPPATGET